MPGRTVSRSSRQQGEPARKPLQQRLRREELDPGSSRLDRCSFIDWSEASITHPFFSLRTVEVSVELTLDLPEGTAPWERLRDAYLEPWLRWGARDDLIRAFELARRLWMIPAALAWHQILSSLEGAEREEYAHAVPWLLREFVDANG